MFNASDIAVLVIAVLHLVFMYLEMVKWDTPAGRIPVEVSPGNRISPRTLLQNQGLYNGFLAAGLIWGAWAGQSEFSIKVFFLACVIVAGLYGGATVGRKILFAQAVPAILALVVVWLTATPAAVPA
jgi:putative membrane protein